MQKSEKPQKKSGNWSAITLSLLGSIFVAVSIVSIYHLKFAPKIVTMDLKGFIKQQKEMVTAGEINQEQLRDNLDAMEAALVSVPPNHTVLLKEVVLRNAQEIKP